MPLAIGQIQEGFATGNYRLTWHARLEMIKDGISPAELEEALGEDEPELLEDYPDDPRGPSCLVLCWTAAKQPLHAVIGYGGRKLEVVTVYKPDSNHWIEFRKRRA